MRKTTLLGGFCFALPWLTAAQGPVTPVSYPVTARINQVDNYFGEAVADPYRWLEDDNAPATAAWVAAENEVTESYLAAIPFRSALHERLTALWNYPRRSAPYREGGYYFEYRNDGVQNQSVLFRTDRYGRPPVPFIDPNTFSADGTVSLGGTALSHDDRYFAYALARSGSDWNQVCVRDLQAGATLADTLNWVKFSGLAWRGDGFYYSGYEDPGAGEALKKKNEFHKVFYHRAGTPQASDVLVFQDTLHPLRSFGASTTEDERFLVVSASESTSGNEVYVSDLSGEKPSRFVQVVEGFGADFDLVDNEDGTLFFRTNDGAPRGKVVAVDMRHPGRDRWKDLVPELPDAVLQGVTVAGDQLVARYIRDAVNFLVFYGRDGRRIDTYTPPVPATVASVSGDRRDSLVFFSVTSFVYPAANYVYNLHTRQTDVVFRPEIAFDFDRYETRQEWYTSKDGTRIPVFIVYRKGLVPDGNNPTLLYGYGGFNISIQPNFSVWRLAFLEAGGVYASANIRGGGEYGEAWHKAGTRLQKQNVFDDFIAAAEYLVARKYTSPAKLAIHGRSNGGLLVGACMTQRPDLFRVALPGVGVMDMLRFHRFTIGWAWTVDYGSSDNEEEFKALYAYSPLHHIRAGVRYPATLVTTADHDDRVVPAHSFKFMATLQALGDPSGPALIRIDTRAGHGAGKPVSKQIDEWTDVLSFTMYHLGMHP